MMAAMPLVGPYRTINLIEAALWGVVGLVTLAYALRDKGRRRAILVVLGVTLLAFGGSDVVEVRTGAWWRPWWMLMWKGMCVTVSIACLGALWRRKRESGSVP